MTRNEEKALLDTANTIKTLLILLVNKLDVKKSDIAKAMGITQARLSQLLDPKKYKG